MKAENRKITVLLAILLAGITAYLSNLLFLQSPHFTKYEGVVSLGVFFVFIPIFFFLILKLFTPAFQKNPHKLALIIGSIVLASLTSYLFAGLIFDWRLVPSHKISAEVLSEKNPDSSGNQATLLSLETTYGILSFAEISQSEGWTRVAKSVLENNNRPGETLSWQGRPGALAKLTFASSPSSGMVLIITDQTSEILDLFSPPDGEVSWENEYAIPVIAYLLPLCALWIFLFCIFLFISIKIFPFTKQDKKIGKYYWLLFTLPMLAVWILYLLAFWPGEMSPDSIVQWGQILSGQFTDTHPAIHTILIWLITKVWLSPAPIAIIQILVMSFSIAWGLGFLKELGLELYAAWLLAIIFALSPINSTMVISIWKDIPYAIALLLFSVQVLKIIISKGEWLGKWINILGIFLTGLCVMLFRHNGVPVPILSLAVLTFYYRKSILRICSLIVVLLITWMLIRGPMYDLAGVSKKGGLENAQFIHHISAHIVTGGQLIEEEQRLANILLPEKVWDYNCCRIDETDSVPGFSWVHLADHPTEVRSLFLKLLIKEPWIDLQDLACSSQVVWSYKGSCGMVITRTISHNRQITENSYGLVAQSKIPQANIFLTNLYNTLFFISRLQFYWYPVLYLIMVILGSVLVTIWKGIRYGYLFCVPAVVQSLVLAMVSLNASDFRYQYGVYLIGLYSLGLLVIAINSYFSKAKEIDLSKT